MHDPRGKSVPPVSGDRIECPRIGDYTTTHGKNYPADQLPGFLFRIDPLFNHVQPCFLRVKRSCSRTVKAELDYFVTLRIIKGLRNPLPSGLRSLQSLPNRYSSSLPLPCLRVLRYLTTDFERVKDIGNFKGMWGSMRKRSRMAAGT